MALVLALAITFLTFGIPVAVGTWWVKALVNIAPTSRRSNAMRATRETHARDGRH
jgi:hypothetical protein